VTELLHERLVGEGNVLRHLELLGFKLSYSQSPLMEYPFAISNLAVDLRDGLRLIKVAEVLTGGWVQDVQQHSKLGYCPYAHLVAELKE
jgi:abnormal spindle-like microcephaly-associated protein